MSTHDGKERGEGIVKAELEDQETVKKDNGSIKEDSGFKSQSEAR